MNAAVNALAELRKQIEANKKLLAEQEHALEVLEAMVGQSSAPAQPIERQIPLVVTPVMRTGAQIDLEELDDASGEGRQTLKSQIADVLKLLGGQEFTGGHIIAALKKSGISVNGKYPRSRVAIILGKLEQEGLVVKTFTGGGKVPNKYMLKEVFDQAMQEMNSSGRQ